MGSKKTEIKSILSIDAYRNISYTLTNQRISKNKSLVFDKSNYVSSFISNKETIVTNIHINNSIPSEDIEALLQNKAYEELNLDEATEYTIKYIELKNAEVENERVFAVFVVEVERLFGIFRETLEETKFIDLVIPESLLYRPLYTREILEKKSIDTFIYITENDAVITLYKNGEYLYSKSIPFSLSIIYEKFCEVKGEKIDESEFFNKLKEEGLKSSDSEYQQLLMRVLGDMFVSINDIIIYIKRAFNISEIDNLFIGTEIGNILGLDSYSNNYLGLDSRDFDFDYNIDTSENYISDYQYLVMLNSIEFIDNEEYTIDFSIFPRPPSFQNRPSGQFIISMFFALSLSVAYPLYFLVSSYVNEAKIFGLEKENTKLTIEANNYKRKIKEVNDKYKITKDKENQKHKILSAKQMTLNAIYDKKVNYRLKSDIFYHIAEDIIKHGVKISKIKTDNNILFLEIVSKNDKSITNFIKYVSEKYFNELNFINIEEIKKDKDADYFTGVLEIELTDKKGGEKIKRKILSEEELAKTKEKGGKK